MCTLFLRQPDIKRNCTHALVIRIDKNNKTIIIFDPQREKFHEFGEKLQLILTNFFNSNYSFTHGEGPRQQYSGDCAITSLLCLERILKNVKLTNNSAKLVRGYKEIICKTLAQHVLD